MKTFVVGLSRLDEGALPIVWAPILVSLCVVLFLWTQRHGSNYSIFKRKNDYTTAS